MNDPVKGAMHSVHKTSMPVGTESSKRSVCRYGRVVTTLLASALLVSGTLACSDDVSVAPVTDLEGIYWTVRINHSAVQMSMTAPYNTLQLEAVPLTADGNPWRPSHDADSVLAASPTEWASLDSSKVRVSSSGVLTARAPTSGVLVIARRQIGAITNIDTTRVQVDTLSMPPTLTTFRVRPADSLKRPMSSTFSLIPVILDQNNAPMSWIPVAVHSYNRNLVRNNGSLGKWSLGMIVFASTGGSNLVRVSTWAYGVAKEDTFTLVSGWPVNPLTGNPAVGQSLSPTKTAVYSLPGIRADIGPGSTLYWVNNSGVALNVPEFTGEPLPGAPMDVIFDDPTNVKEVITPAANNSGAGNIIGIPSDIALPALSRRRYRRFSTPGEYWYTVQPFGLRGVVVVHDQ